MDMTKADGAMFAKKIKDSADKLFSSDLFIVVFAIFTFAFSFIKRGDLTFSLVLVIADAVFLTQKDLKCLFVPLVLAYFAMPFLLGGIFKLSVIFILAVTATVASVIVYFIKNKPKFKFTYTLLWSIPYAASYPLGGIFTKNYLQDGIYLQGLGLFFLIAGFMIFFAMLAANSSINKEYTMKIIFALGMVVSLQILTRATFMPSFLEEASKDRFMLNWGIYNGVITVMLFAIPSCFYFSIKYPRFALVFTTSAVLYTVASILTASRAAVAFMPPFLLISMLITIYFIKSPWRLDFFKNFAIPAVIALTIFVFIYLFAPTQFNQIFSAFIKSGFSDNGRAKIWEKSLDLFFESPIFGKGFFHNSDEKIGLTGGFWLSHNTVLQALSSLGIVGFITLFIHTIAKYTACLKNDTFCIFVLMMFISTELYGMIDCTMPAPYYVFPLIALMITLDLANDSRERQKKLEQETIVTVRRNR